MFGRNMMPPFSITKCGGSEIGLDIQGINKECGHKT
jgi:hypothetical protein